MKTIMILQTNGTVVYDYIKRLRPRQVRLASAYVSQETILLLGRFKRTQKSLLFDYDPGRLTQTFLRALLAAQPKGVYVAERTPLFHPKIFIFDEARLMHLFVGSSNATRGGLRANVETMFYHVLDRSYDAPAIADVEKLWNRLRRIANTRLTATFIATRASELATRTPVPKRGRRASTKPMPRRQGFVADWSLPTVLQKIIGRETGTGGTQVQIPVDVVGQFFGNDGVHPAQLQLLYLGRLYTTNITHHGNNTHRISMGFLAGVRRPSLLQLERVAQSVYEVKVFSSSSRQYSQVLRNGTVARRGANPYRYIK